MSTVDAVYLANRQVALDRDGRSCARCGRPATDTHHRRPRGFGGSSRDEIHAPQNLVALCRDCHSWAHSEVEAAARLGYFVSRWRDPADVPVLWHGQLVSLTPGGTVLIPATPSKMDTPTPKETP